jgi:enoyl-CoA hydratase/carnithine racemase
VLCVIDGPALGGGLEMALNTDIRIATKGASIGLTETKWSLIPGAGGTQTLARLIGVAKAKELIFTARRLSGLEAKDLGIVEYVEEDYQSA